MEINGIKVRQIRKGKSIPIASVALAVDFTPSWVQSMERKASAKVNEPTAKALARHLGVKLEEIVAAKPTVAEGDAQA